MCIFLNKNPCLLILKEFLPGCANDIWDQILKLREFNFMVTRRCWTFFGVLPVLPLQFQYFFIVVISDQAHMPSLEDFKWNIIKVYTKENLTTLYIILWTLKQGNTQSVAKIQYELKDLRCLCQMHKAKGHKQKLHITSTSSKFLSIWQNWKWL